MCCFRINPLLILATLLVSFCVRRSAMSTAKNVLTSEEYADSGLLCSTSHAVVNLPVSYDAASAWILSLPIFVNIWRIRCPGWVGYKCGRVRLSAFLSCWVATVIGENLLMGAYGFSLPLKPLQSERLKMSTDDLGEVIIFRFRNWTGYLMVLISSAPYYQIFDASICCIVGYNHGPWLPWPTVFLIIRLWSS